MEIILIIVGLFVVIWIWNGLTSLFSSRPVAPTPAKTDIELTDEFKQILDILEYTSDNIYITGKAGTGKSSLLNYFTKQTNKKFVVLAPTGIAALNVGGSTIHSFFKFPAKIIDPNQIRPDYVRAASLFKDLQMVIIDEVSMCRSDLMNGVDVALRKNRNRQNEPFGGVQMVFIGDLFQLPPVVTPEDRDQILNTYGGEYFFDAPVFGGFRYHFKELTKIFRQSSEQTRFKNLLNNIRTNSATFEDMVDLNERHREYTGAHDNSVFLTTRRKIARDINCQKLAEIKAPEFEFIGELSGTYEKLANEDEDKLDARLPAPYKLKLRRGAQIMMVKNDPGKRWVNGSVGKVTKVTQNEIWVAIDSRQHKIEKDNWKEVEYKSDPTTHQIYPITLGSFSQYPLQLAFAMTIHKSQGKTFDKITVDVGSGAFAHGQVYVALSRCKSLQGIILSNEIKDSDIIVDQRVVDFYADIITKKTVQPKPAAEPKQAIREVLTRAIKANSHIIIDYENYDGEVSRRELSNLQISNDFAEQGYRNAHITAHCHLRKEERSFKIDRIIRIEMKD